jgi:TetR/AcrR family transcriptional regulator
MTLQAHKRSVKPRRKLTLVAAAPRATAPDARARILTAALVQFAEHGYEGTRTAEIARQAGVTHPLVHYHFRTKDQLWKAVVDEALGRLRAAFDGTATELRDVGSRERLKILVRRFVRFSAEHPDVTRLMIREGAHDTPRLRWLVRHHVGALIRPFEETLAAGQREGWAKPLPRAHVLFLCVGAASYVFSATAMLRLTHQIDVRSPAAIEAHADTLVEIMFHGMVRES